MLKRNIKYLLIFLLVCAAIFLLEALTDFSCAAISRYNWSVQNNIDSYIYPLAEKIIVLLASLSLLLFTRNLSFNARKNLKLACAILVPILVFRHGLQHIPGHIANREITGSICAKSNLNGPYTETKHMTAEEYRFLKNDLQLLPTLPASADDISISYYNEPFLGDYSLGLHFRCNAGEPLQQQGKRWQTESTDTAASKKYILYEAGTK